RKGVSFRAFAAARKEGGLYPRYQATVGGEIRFVYSEEELSSVKEESEAAEKMSHEEKLASIPPEEITEEMRAFQPKPLPFFELYDPNRLAALSQKLSQFHLKIEDYVIAKGEALCEIQEEGEKKSAMYTLKELIDFIRVHGRKGIEVQRYKGLGEMNADQLWETTMDPALRTLLKVTLPDAIAADRMFSMLMGEEVEPR